MAAGQAQDPIKHVVVLILENHSFDQMLGGLRAVNPQINGVDPQNPGINLDPQGNSFKQVPTQMRQIFDDPHHEVEHVWTQLSDNSGGFVRDFADAYPQSSAVERAYIMGYYEAGFLPALHALAQEFTLCDRWHAALPGPTWPNRFFALAGTSCGKVDMPDDGEHRADIKGYFEQDQTTIFDRLNEKSVPWKCYFSGIPQSIVMLHQRRPENFARYFDMAQFYADANAANAEQDFPAFSLIEPDFLGVGENDDHPPHDVMKAQTLVADVYNALRANKPLWDSTLFVLFYDEHGGFYDHVSPPPALPPDEYAGYPFTRYGVRVPALLISPWVAQTISSTLFDHTSVLRYLIDKWGLGSLGKRAAVANSIGALITDTKRSGTLPSITIPQNILASLAASSAQAAAVVSGHHKALVLLMNSLEEEATDRGGNWITRAWRNLYRPAAKVGAILPADVAQARADFGQYFKSRKTS